MDERTVPYFAHEGDMARMERTNRRQFIIILVLIFAFIASNAGWLYYESQFETETTTVQQEAEWEEGSNIIMNGTGGVTINGESEPDNNNKKANP